MHILFVGYGQTSQRVAQYLSEQNHNITAISRSCKTDHYANHFIQDVHELDLRGVAQIDLVYIVLAPSSHSLQDYENTYLASIEPIIRALRSHPIRRIILVSSTRVYAEDEGGERDDDSPIYPSDEKAKILYNMELKWRQAYPEQLVIVRPSGIYGMSVKRLIHLATEASSYPNIHYTNRIHIDDLARFLAYLVQLDQVQPSYIVTDNQPLAMHEILAWFQQQLGLPLLELQSQRVSGKRLKATHMNMTGFQLRHINCFDEYLIKMREFK